MRQRIWIRTQMAMGMATMTVLLIWGILVFNSSSTAPEGRWILKAWRTEDTSEIWVEVASKWAMSNQIPIELRFSQGYILGFRNHALPPWIEFRCGWGGLKSLSLSLYISQSEPHPWVLRQWVSVQSRGKMPQQGKRGRGRKLGLIHIYDNDNVLLQLGCFVNFWSFNRTVHHVYKGRSPISAHQNLNSASSGWGSHPSLPFSSWTFQHTLDSRMNEYPPPTRSPLRFISCLFFLCFALCSFLLPITCIHYN